MWVLYLEGWPSGLRRRLAKPDSHVTKYVPSSALKFRKVCGRNPYFIEAFPDVPGRDQLWAENYTKNYPKVRGVPRQKLSLSLFFGGDRAPYLIVSLLFFDAQPPGLCAGASLDF
jgi:hypothetical protein